MTSINLKAYSDDPSKINALMAFMKALSIKFEFTDKDEKPYDDAFVAKIQKSQDDYKKGEGKTYTVEELNKLWK